MRIRDPEKTYPGSRGKKVPDPVSATLLFCKIRGHPDPDPATTVNKYRSLPNR